MSEPVAERFWSKVDRSGDCWLWTGARTDQGYGRFMLNRKSRHAPRVAYELTVGPILGGLFVLHRCDNPPCVNPSHLFLGTNADNMIDAVRKGRSPRTKLSMEQVREIRAAAAAGVPKKRLARTYGVDPATIRWVIQRKSWAHVE